MADGLSNSVVFCIGQDKDGFIWVGTGNGLNIYDGNRINQIYSEPDNEQTIPFNAIEDMLFVGDSVWIATRGGLCKMDVRTKKCRRIDLGKNTDVRTLFLNKDKSVLWIGTQSGLIKYSIEQGNYIEFNTSNSNISHNIIRTIYEDSDENLWVGTFNKLNYLPQNSSVFESYDLKQEYRSSIKNNLTIEILPYTKENDSLLWVGTQTGLVLFNRVTKKNKVFREDNSKLTNSVIKTIHHSTNGEFWIGTDFGLAQMKPEFNFQVHLHDPFDNNSLINSIVWDIFEDDSGTLWFGTNNGISILSKNSNRFQFIPMTFNRDNNISGYEIRRIIEDNNEDLWIATQFGFLLYNHEKGVIESFNSNQSETRRLLINSTKYLLKDRKDRLWVGTNGGVVIWNPEEKILKRFSANFSSGHGLRSNYIYDFYELKDGTILVNTVAGLHKVIEEDGNIRFIYLKKLGQKLKLSDNTLYLYNNSSVYKIDVETYDQTLENSFTIDGKEIDILSMEFSDKNTLWIGVNKGLIRYDMQTKKYQIFEIKSNKDYEIINILFDDYGNIWASSYSSIIKFIPADGDFEVFSSRQEIPISGFVEGASMKSTKGDLIFGGYDGFIRFNPADIEQTKTTYPLVITRLQVANQNIEPGKSYNGQQILDKNISYTKQLTLNYSNRSFSLEFTTLQFDRRDDIRFAYKLDNVDTDWNYYNGPSGKAVYSGLRAGKYQFILKGKNNHGVWNDQETRLDITIKPPLWASPFFVALYIILFVTILWSIIYYYRNREKMKGELEIIRIEKKHTNNLAKARQQFFTNVAHEFRTPLNLITGPVEKLLKNKSLDCEGKRYVSLIDNNVRRLLWLNNQFIEFRLLENKTLGIKMSRFDLIEFTRNIYLLFTDKAERKDITYEFQSEFESLDVFMDLRKIETILFNLISNAFKFTDNYGKIGVSIKQRDNATEENAEPKICITVSDTGIGISEEDKQKVFSRFYQAKEASRMERGSGIGLTLVDEYVKMHNGKILLESQPGKGSKFNIILPLQKEYTAEDEKSATAEKGELEPMLKQSKQAHSTNGHFIQFPIKGKPTILLVEDENDIVDFIALCFQEKYNLIIANNGKEALQKIVSQVPDLVISDIVMPKMDGIEFTKKLKSNPKTAHVPLILLTGQSQPEKQLEGLKSGADAYVAKPFEIELLEVRINNFLKRREQLIEYLRLDKFSNPKKVDIPSQDEKWLERIVNCIENNISEPNFGISILSEQTGFSANSLYRKIKSLTGRTTNDFIRTVRIRRAEQLLRTKKFTVAEVMDQTGFSNHSYFSKCFRKVYNMAPREYIEQL